MIMHSNVFNVGTNYRQPGSQTICLSKHMSLISCTYMDTCLHPLPDGKVLETDANINFDFCSLYLNLFRWRPSLLRK